MITRAEHLQWCKDRALEYCKEGEYRLAVTSMIADVDKHDETRGHIGNQIAIVSMMTGGLNTRQECETFINGYN